MEGLFPCQIQVDGWKVRWLNRTAAPALFQDFKQKALLELHAGGPQDGADRHRDAPLFTDDLADVTRSDAQFLDGDLLAFDSLHRYFVGAIHQSLGDLLNELPHLAPPRPLALQPRGVVRSQIAGPG